jgi:hypothetical protein
MASDMTSFVRRVGNCGMLTHTLLLLENKEVQAKHCKRREEVCSASPEFYLVLR